MENKPEGGQGPVSEISKQVLADLQSQGHEIAKDTEMREDEDGQVKDREIEKPAPVIEPKKEVDNKEDNGEDDEEDATKPDEKPNRESKFIPAYKYEIIKNQKASTEKQLAEANAKIEELSKQKPSELSNSEKKELGDAYKVIAEKHNVDPELLKDLKNLLASEISTPAEVMEKLKELDTIKADRAKEFADNAYNKEFDKDILPLLKAEYPDISDETLSSIKNDLKTIAFTEEYGKLPLNKVFMAEKSSFKIVSNPKRKSSETVRPGASRSIETIDYDNMDENTFNSLPPAKQLEFSRAMASKNNAWKK